MLLLISLEGNKSSIILGDNPLLNLYISVGEFLACLETELSLSSKASNVEA